MTITFRDLGEFFLVTVPSGRTFISSAQDQAVTVFQDAAWANPGCRLEYISSEKKRILVSVYGEVFA